MNARKLFVAFGALETSEGSRRNSGSPPMYVYISNGHQPLYAVVVNDNVLQKGGQESPVAGTATLSDSIYACRSTQEQLQSCYEEAMQTALRWETLDLETAAETKYYIGATHSFNKKRTFVSQTKELVTVLSNENETQKCVILPVYSFDHPSNACEIDADLHLVHMKNQIISVVSATNAKHGRSFTQEQMSLL